MDSRFRGNDAGWAGGAEDGLTERLQAVRRGSCDAGRTPLGAVWRASCSALRLANPPCVRTRQAPEPEFLPVP